MHPSARGMEERIRAVPVVGDVAVRTFWRLISFLRHPGTFHGSVRYWRRRYVRGGDSGSGSSGRLAAFKAEVINRFVARQRVRSVIELGCGDGSQLRLARYPQYIGFDVSAHALAACRRTFRGDASKQFRAMRHYRGERAELALSLDVVYHLVEDAVFERYMHTLFGAAERFVIIYSSDTDDNRGYHGTHIRHRRFTEWIDAHLSDWTLSQRIPNRYRYRGNPRTGSFADFFIYVRTSAPSKPPSARTAPR
jgi:SAM-dependent methyltransferase